MLSPAAGRQSRREEMPWRNSRAWWPSPCRSAKRLILGGLSGTVGKFAESSSWLCYSETHPQCAGSARPSLFGGGDSSVVRVPDS